MQVVVVGGGIGGLASALTLGRAGHAVTLLERDDTPLPPSADEAFWWNRRGAPQVRHSHAFLARLVQLLRERHPDVLAALLDAGASEIRYGDGVPETVTNYEPAPSDDELTMLACRRTTFEWVLRKAVLADPGVRVLGGQAVTGLSAAAPAGAAAGGPPHVTGVRVASGDSLDADLVVMADGRRSALIERLGELGVGPLPETLDDTGITYASRFYRLADGVELGHLDGRLVGGDLGYLKYGIFPGDNRTFSITLAAPIEDAELRNALTDPATFDRAASTLRASEGWIGPGVADPVTEVHTMAGLVNRRRRLVVDGEPLVTGVVAVGDALICTNPLYGRGCTLAFWGAELLADAIASTGADAVALAVAYDGFASQHLAPWHDAARAQDGEAKRVAAAHLTGDDPDDPGDPRSFLRAVYRDGLVPAMRTDAVVHRAVVRSFNLLSPPDALMADAAVTATVLAAYEARGSRPPEPDLGPRTRAELLAAIA